MKKVYYLYTWLVITAIVACYSCLKQQHGEPDQIPNQTFSIEEAEAFFNDSELKAWFSGSSTKSNTWAEEMKQALTPRWDKSRSFTFKGRLAVETAFHMPPSTRTRIDSTEINASDSLQVSVVKKLNTMAKLLSEKIDEGLISYKVVEITATDAYLDSIRGKVKTLTLTNLEKFSGHVRYYDLSGSLLEGEIYREGEIVGHIYPDAPEPPVSQTGIGTRYWESGWYCEYVRYTTDHCNIIGYWDSSEFIQTGDHCWSEYEFVWECYDIRVWIDDPVEPDPGNGGGGGGTDPGNPNPGGGNSSTAPNASKIYRNPNLTVTNWQNLERMTNEIRKDCMGSLLYSGLDNFLNGKALNLDVVMDRPSIAGFDPVGGSITLNSYVSHTLFHETLHGYQAYGETLSSWGGATLNMEVEAWVAEYMYAVKQPEYQPGDPYYEYMEDSEVGTATKKICENLSSDGRLNGNCTESEFRNKTRALANALHKRPAYAGLQFDSNRSIQENLKNLQRLAKDC